MALVDNMGEDINDIDYQENDADEPGTEDFDTLQELYDGSFKEIQSGKVVKGKVISVKQDEVIVDIGAKCEGAIPLEEFMSDEKDHNVYVGREFDVYIVKRENQEGAPVLSRHKAREIVARDNIRRAYENGEPIECRAVKVVKGGLQVDCGINGFMPFSHTGVRRGQQSELEELVGQTFLAKIIEMRGRQDAVLSRRLCLEEERDKRRHETLGLLQEGALVKGVVKNLTDFGAFVDLGGIDGLLHINDMSWQHVTRPEDVVAVGQELEVLVLQIDGDRISLGLKQKSRDPWEDVFDRYPAGAIVSGQITSLTKYGAFVELEPGVEGLIHISEMSWTHRIKHPSDVFQVGDTVSAQILKVDDASKRISLGYKQTLDNPWALAEVKYPINSSVEGTVVGLTDFGAFVRLEDGVDGMIHVSDMSWTKKVNHPSEVLQEGDAVQAVVLEVNGESKRISLGLKQVDPDPWTRAKKRYRLGNHAEGTVIKVTDFGAFVELEEGIEGLIHISEISDRRVDHPEDMLKVGDRIQAKVIKSDAKNRKIGLSIREYQNDMERQEVQKYMGSGEESLGTMGDLISSALRRYDMEAEAEASQQTQEPETESSETEPIEQESAAEPETVPAIEPEPAAEPIEEELVEQETLTEEVVAEEEKVTEETAAPEEPESEDRESPVV